MFCDLTVTNDGRIICNHCGFTWVAHGTVPCLYEHDDCHSGSWLGYDDRSCRENSRYGRRPQRNVSVLWIVWMHDASGFGSTGLSEEKEMIRCQKI